MSAPSPQQNTVTKAASSASGLRYMPSITAHTSRLWRNISRWQARLCLTDRRGLYIRTLDFSAPEIDLHFR
jgi:hypothetical protein